MDNKLSDQKLYTLEEIKEAFWKSFHKSGELWFNYLSDEESNKESTEEHWRDFSDYLKDPATPVDDYKRYKF